MIDPLANSQNIVPTEMMMRIARRLRSLPFPNPDENVQCLHFWYLAAKAAIEEMREPTINMCCEGADVADSLSLHGAKNVYQAMIYSALR